MAQEGRNTDSSTAETADNRGLTDYSRRSVLQISGFLGATGVASYPVMGASSKAQDDQDGSSRAGNAIEGSTVIGKNLGSDVVDAISTDSISNQVIATEFSGVTEQVAIFSQELQGFPQQGDNFVVLSNGLASEASGTPDTFASTNILNGTSNTDYSPDGYDAYNIADITVSIEIPEDATGIAFDYKFGTEENPGFLDSQYQDFFEVQFYDPNGGVQNIALIDGEPVTVNNANTVSNSPGGSSQSPTEPLPSPTDVSYNAVTTLQTVSHDVSSYQGEQISLVFRIADASDGVYDSAAFIDNLRFTNDVQTDPTPVRNALEGYEQSFKEYQKRQFEGEAHHIARLYDEFGDEYGELLTNYWGYQAGEVSKSAIDDGMREVSDSTIETISPGSGTTINEENAAVLYNFYDELFSELSESNSSLQTTIQTTIRYFLGTHANQTNYLTFDGGKTVAEGLNQSWDLSDTVYSQISQEKTLTQSQIQRIAEGLERRGTQFADRGKKYIQSRQQAAESIIRSEVSGSTKIHAEQLEKSTASSQDVDANLAASTVAVATGLIGIGAFASGYVITKCSGAFSAAQTSKGVEFTAVSLSLPHKAVVGTVNSMLNFGTVISGYSAYDSESVNTQGVLSSWIGSNYYAGAKVAAVDLSTQTALLFSETELAEQASAEITDLTLPNVTDTVEMGLLDSFVNSIQGFFDDLLGGWYNYSAPKIGEATGSVTIKNTGPIAYEPKFGVDYQLFDGNELIGSGYPITVSGDKSTMQPGEERTFDVVYKAPLDEGLLSGSATIEFGLSPVAELPISSKSDLIPLGICELDYNALQADTIKSSFSVNEAAATETVSEGSSTEGEVKSYTYSPESSVNNALLELSYKQHYSDLHLYDSQNNEVGYDYSSNSVVTEIEGATYSGRDTGTENQEWISFPPKSGEEYTVEIHTPEIGTVGQSIEATATQDGTATLVSEYNLGSSEVSTLPPKLAITPSTISATSGVNAGEPLDLSLVIDEVNGEQAAEGVTISSTNLSAEDGSVIPAENISFNSNNLTVTDPVEIGCTISVPGEASGVYSGQFEITSSNADSKTVDVSVEVGSFDGIVAEYNQNNDEEISLIELSDAATDYANGDITLTDMAKIAQAYVTT